MSNGFYPNSPSFLFEYTLDGKSVSSTATENDDYALKLTCSEDRIKLTLVPKKEISLMRFTARYHYNYKPRDLFFANGYQSWTTSREYDRFGKMKDMIPLAATESLKELAGISSDWRFTDTPEKTGVFISHTYTYVRNGDSLFFIGSLTEKTGFTVFSTDMNTGRLDIVKDIEGVTTADEYELFDVYFTLGSYDAVFDGYFSAMGLAEPRIKHMSGYTSWYNYFQKIDEKIIIRDLNALDRVKESVSIFQVDDGYETFVGDWLDPNPEKFPSGMGFIAEKAHEKGYQAGIWLAPFNVQRASRTFKEHPDWCITKNGKPLLGCAGWGGAFTLDIYNEDARNYIKSFFDVILNDWGYDMVKLDFLYSQCMYPRNNKSRGTIMCEAMEFLRECCGDKLILGCGVPIGASFGYVDACRISCDVDLKYSGKFYNALHVNNEVPSAQNAITNSVFRRHLNGRAFCSDPDVFFLRYSNLTFTMGQKKLLALVNHLCGDVLFVSDCMDEYTDADLSLVKKAFAPSDNVKIISAGFEAGYAMAIRYVEDGEEKLLRFDLKSGLGNASKLI